MDPCMTVDDITLVDPPRALDRGFFGLGGYLDVDEGTVAVITESGAYRATIQSGHHSLGQYQWGRDVKAHLVQTKLRTLDFVSMGDFYVEEVGENGTKAAIKVNVQLAIEYQVLPGDAQIVALRIDKPVRQLCRATMDAVRESAQYLTFEAFRTGGRDLAKLVKIDLKQRGIEQRTGLSVVDVVPISFTGADRINEQRIQQVLNSRERVDSEWMIRNRPDLFSQLQGQRFEIVKMMLERGLNPTAILDQPLNAQQDILQALLMPSTSRESDQITRSRPHSVPHAQTAEQTTAEPVYTKSVSPERIDREWAALEAVASRVEGQPGLRGERSIPDGTFNFNVNFLAPSGQEIQVHLHLPLGFDEGAVPRRRVLIDGKDQEFPTIGKAEWRSDQRLVRIVQDVKQYYS